MRTITTALQDAYKQDLLEREKASATVEKYLRDLAAFQGWLGQMPLTKSAVLDYKQYLIKRYAPASVNSMLSSLNGFFRYMEWYDLPVRFIKIQHQPFTAEERFLTKQEYARLLEAARRQENKRLFYLMQTICSLGLRVSELRFITAAAVQSGRAEIRCKGKVRVILLPPALCRTLTDYLQEAQIKSGPVFVTKTGKPLNRTNIWADMKKLCRLANVSEKKVFPHNLRHLFARTYYSLQKDIVSLSDVLGHSNINTTRIYTAQPPACYKKYLQKLGLLFSDIKIQHNSHYVVCRI